MLRNTNSELVLEWTTPVISGNENELGKLNRILQDYLIIRVANLFDRDTRAISFENTELKNNANYKSIKKEEIIKYIIDQRCNFVAHWNKKRGNFIDTAKILDSDLDNILCDLEKLL
ncbi:MAG: hypothetical protein V1901_00310 [Patescibacteria group bacterium]|nr:hypothetical protein [Patescibacteria group bacterium]